MDGRNRLLSIDYDSAGNAIVKNGVSYIYNAEGEITSAGGTTYGYDGSGMRVSKPNQLYWRGNNSAALTVTDANGNNPTMYIFFHGQRIARLDPGSSSPKYYVEDDQGSTSLVTDASGNVLNESLFFPYGGEMVVSSQTSNTYKFTGKERDPETGNDYFGARYYSSNEGRFMSPDWDGKPTAVPYASFGDPQTLNLYAYVENSPVDRVDADGHAANQSTANNWPGLEDWQFMGSFDWSGLVAWHEAAQGSNPFDGLTLLAITHADQMAFLAKMDFAFIQTYVNRSSSCRS